MKIPRTKKDILVSAYLKYVEYIKSEPTSENEILRNTIKIFYDIDDEKLDSFEYSVVLDMFQIIDNILKIEQKLVERFEHKGVEYAINPKFDDMTFAEMVDCDTEDVMQQICILYRPIKKKSGKNYTIQKYKADVSILEELRETLTLDVYLGFISFFLKINEDILNYTLNSLTDQVSQVEKKNHLVKSGLGMVGYMTYATQI